MGARRVSLAQGSRDVQGHRCSQEPAGRGQRDRWLPGEPHLLFAPPGL